MSRRRVRGAQDEVDGIVDAWSRELPAALSDASALAKRITLLGAALGEAGRQALTALGFTYAEFDVLATLRRSGKPYRMVPSELTRSLMLTSGGVSNVLQRLETAGLVVREAREGDARSRWVRLTTDGRREAESMILAVTDAHADVLAAVPTDVLDRAADVLREVMLARSARPVRAARRAPG